MQLTHATSIVSLVLGLAVPPQQSTARHAHWVRYITNHSSPVVDVVIVGHEDDWQLFMGDVLVEQRELPNQRIFVYLTAGDAGRDSSYWRTRERAALASTRLAAGGGHDDADRCDFVSISDHRIWHCASFGADSYFLRLPDGTRNGRGLADHGFQSLWRLHRRRIPRISAVDESTTYSSWSDLVRTVGALGGDLTDSRVRIYSTDPSVVVNPHDHTDHRVAGLITEELRKDRKWTPTYFAGYALATRADNLSQTRRQLKTSLFLAYENEMTRVHKNWGAYHEHPKFYSQCLARTYHRTPGVAPAGRSPTQPMR